MNEAPHVPFDPSIFYVGNPVALVTTHSPDGTVNIGPTSSTFVLGRTLVMGWEESAATAANLAKQRQAVVNFPAPAQWSHVDAIATLTGKNPPAAHKADQFTYTNDKWTPGGFTPQPATHVQPPRIAECPLQCEVTVTSIYPARGVDADRFLIVETSIETIHATTDVLSDPTHIDTTEWSPLLYVFRDYHGTGSRLGTSRRT